jgi:hypothetical protein
MNMPAAMARIARIIARPPIEMNADNPVSMSHMANNRKPILFVNFMVTILSYVYGDEVSTHTTINTPRVHPSAGEYYYPPLGGGTC